MARQNKIMANLVGGEISPLMAGRVDLATFNKSVAKMENYIALPQGGAKFRMGTIYVKSTRLNRIATLIPFQFNDSQAFVIEATDKKFRFYTLNGVVTGNDQAISGLTNANPGSVTVTAHGYATGQTVIINNVGGMTQVNGNTYTITVTGANTFTIGVDTTGYGTYTASTGKVTAIYPITGVTNANPGVFTVLNHGFSNGDEVNINSILGVSGLNGQFFLVANATTNTFTLTDLFGNAINTTASGTYVSGGFAARVYEITTPYAQADLPNLQWAQTASTMYITHQSYEPRKLTETSTSNWAIATFTRTGGDPFPSNNSNAWPRACCFDGAGRLYYGGTLANQQTVWGSSAPSGGTTNYDDFTTGTSKTNAVIFTLAPVLGKIDSIEWISNTSLFMVIGCFGSVRSLYGAAVGQPADALNINTQPLNGLGTTNVLPNTSGDYLFYLQRGSQRVRNIQYDILIQNYTTIDKTLVAEHLTTPGVVRMCVQRTYPDLQWYLLSNGKFLALTYERVENVSGWGRHYLGGNSMTSNGVGQSYANVLSLAPMPRTAQTDQMWFVVERQIGGQTVRTIEYFADEPIYPNERDFFTGVNNKTNDETAFQNALYQAQKQACHLDMANVYDGSLLGSQANVSLTLSATTGTITMTASAPIFTAAMVGQMIRNSYDYHDSGAGLATITGFTDSTHVTCLVTVPFPDLDVLAPGTWYLTSQNITGMNYLNGETVSVIVDGGPHPNCVVANGQITLNYQGSVVIVGYPYTGTIETLNIDVGGQTGTAESKSRVIWKCVLRVLNSLGEYIGTNYYSLNQVPDRLTPFQVSRPALPFTGLIKQQYNLTDGWTDPDTDPYGKRVIISQQLPLPSTILSLDMYVNAAEE